MAQVKWIDFPYWGYYANGQGICMPYYSVPHGKGWRQCMHGYMAEAMRNATIYVDEPSVDAAIAKMANCPPGTQRSFIYTKADIMPAIRDAVLAWKDAAKQYFGRDPGFPFPNENAVWSGAAPAPDCLYPAIWIRWVENAPAGTGQMFAPVTPHALTTGLIEIGYKCHSPFPDGSFPPPVTYDGYGLVGILYGEFRHLFGVGHTTDQQTPNHDGGPGALENGPFGEYWNGKCLWIIHYFYESLFPTPYIDTHPDWCP